MADRILDAWWETNLAEAEALAAESDLLAIESLHAQAPRHMIAEFRCRGLVRRPDGRIVEHDHFAVGLAFPPDYLHRVDAQRVLTLLSPIGVFHPNMLGRLVCPGHLHPGLGISPLLYQVFEMLTYRHYALHDPLNHDAATWARQPENRARFPLDRRPLKRRRTLPQEVGG